MDMHLLECYHIVLVFTCMHIPLHENHFNRIKRGTALAILPFWQGVLKVLHIGVHKEVRKMARLTWKQICSEERIPAKSGGLASRYRSEMESDYHRIIRSASFRRLQDKTQVFPLDKSDFVRTRLTHSLEVASIAKLIGKQVCTLLYEQEKEAVSDLPDALHVIEILNCAGLLHDIGNPPFGHFGESAIRNWFAKNLKVLKFREKPLDAWLDEQQQCDLLYFEGNAQALRIMSKLHRLTGTNGLHLTSGVMDSIIKYPCNSLQKKQEDKLAKSQRSLLRKKIGYYQSETGLYRQIKANTGTWDCRNPLCFMLEAADDLAYTFADLEDGYKKGLYSYDELSHVVEQCGDEKGAQSLRQALEQGKKEQETSENGFDPYQYAIFTWLTRKQLFCISRASEAFLANYDAIMEGSFEQELLAVSSEGALIQSLKRFAYDKVYNDAKILKLELMGNEIVTFLLDRFMDALIVFDSEEAMSEIQEKYVDLLSKNYLHAYLREAKGKPEGERLYLRLLLGSDFVAGMTDSYAQQLYRELKGI